MPPDSAKAHHWNSLSQWAGALFAVGLVLYFRPYHGIRHDSILYFGQAAALLKPEQFGHDLFFAHGSQSEFTLFPAVLAELLRHFQAAELFMALSLASRVGFLVGAFALCCNLLPKRYRYWGLIALLVMPSGYGGFGMLSYGETFVTARSVAEPIILLALAALLGKRWLLSTALLVLGAALHPLQALPAILVTWIALVWTDRRWLHALWVGIAIIVAGLAETNLREFIFARFDGAWLEWTKEATGQIFVLRWRLNDWCYLVTDIFLISNIACRIEGRLRWHAQVLVVSTIVAFISSIVLVDLFHFTLPAGLQLWRVQWLVHWFAMASLPVQLLRLYAEGDSQRPRLLLLVAIAILGAPTGYESSLSLVFLLIPLFWLWPTIRPMIQPSTERIINLGLTLLLAVVFAKFALSVVSDLKGHADLARERLSPEFLLLSHPLLLGGFTTLVLVAWHDARRWQRAGMIVLLAGAIPLAFQVWDRRSTERRQFEASEGNSSVFGVELAAGAEVLWLDHLLGPWMVLHRPSYFSFLQVAGSSFNRGTAIEAAARRHVTSNLLLAHKACEASRDSSTQLNACHIDENMLRRTCDAAGGRLRYVVMPYKLKSDALGHWSIPREVPRDRPLTYYIYDCNALASSPSQ